MKRTFLALAALGIMGAVAPGCAYGGVAVEDGKAVIARNDGLLFGLLRKVYVCQVTDSGLTNCQEGTAP